MKAVVDWVSNVLSDARFRLRAIFRRHVMEREMEEELQFHLEREAQKHEQRGMSARQAQRLARLSFGGIDRFKEEARDARGLRFLETLARDLRYAIRGLRQRPGFAAAVVLTLGLGLGANAAMFGVVDYLFFRPPPYLRDPGMVHRVYLFRTERGLEQNISGLEYKRYLDFVRWTTTFSQLAAYGGRLMAVGDGEVTRELPVAAVTSGFFDFFDMQPALGRFFTPDEDTPPVGAPVAVLSYALWQSHYAGRTDVIGTQLRVGSLSCTIIGVTPAGFTGDGLGGSFDVYLPTTTYAPSVLPPDRATEYYTGYSWSFLGMLVRRSPGISVTEASADLTAAFRQSYATERNLNPGMPDADVARPRAALWPLPPGRGPEGGRTERVSTWLAGVAVIVLIISCANITNLFLARALSRRREMGLRLALGAGRSRLLTQLLTESVLFACLGALAGALAAQWASTVLRSFLLPEGTPLTVVQDPRTIALTCALALTAGVVTGGLPALHASRRDLVTALKTGAREGTSQRSVAGTWLVVLQGALSVMLLVGAGLFVQSLRNVRALPLGFDVDPVLFVFPNPRGQPMTSDERLGVARRLVEEARVMPEIASAALGASVPFWNTWGQRFTVPGVDSVQRFGRFTVQAVSEHFFVTMGTRLLRGRAISDADDASAPLVAVVSEGMARAVWPTQNALGQCIHVHDGRDRQPCTTVVGIVENVKQTGLGDDQQLQWYLPIGQARTAPPPGLFVRTRDEHAMRQVEVIRRRLQPLMPGAGYLVVTPMREIVDQRLHSWRLGATMFVAFGGLALVVAAVGLYSVVAYHVAQQKRDLSVRVALGAGQRNLFWLVLRKGVGFAGAGVAIGLGLSLTAGPLVAPLLFDVSPRDPAVLTVASGLMLVIAVVACLLPARHALRVDPCMPLRAE